MTLTLTVVVPASAIAQEKQEPDDIQKIAVGNPDATFLDQLATNGIPGAIGELLAAQSDKMGGAFTDAAKAGALNSDLIARKHFADRIANINQALGRLLAVMDVGGKVYAGNYEDAAWSAGLAVLTELGGTQAGKGALAYVGCSTTAPVTAAVIAIQVYRESVKQVAQTKGAVQLESLYGSIENQLRERGRKLGEGDPFPVTQENVDKIWRRVFNDPDFRSRFQQYVTDQLQQPFPEPGFFDKYLASEEENEHTVQAELQKNKKELKMYITGLIGTLNRAAKADEQRMVAVKAIEELQRFFKSNGAEMEDGLRKFTAALKNLPEAADWANGAEARVRQYIKDKSTDSLSAERAMIVMYVRDVIRWIPDKGPFAEDRNRIYTKLKSAYEASLVGTETLNKEFEELAKKPKVPEGKFSRDPRSYYEEYFEKEVKPFDWDGSGGPDSAKALLQGHLEAGNFRGPRDPAELPRGRKPLAEIVIEAWNKENYYVACNGGDYVPGKVPPPEIEKTIDGYAEEINEKLSDIVRNSPLSTDEETRDAFFAASGMARQAVSSHATLAKAEHEDAALWMLAAYEQYRDYALQLWQKASDVHVELSAFGCSAFGQAYNPGALQDSQSLRNQAQSASYLLAPEGNEYPLTFQFLIGSDSPATWTTNGNKTYGGKQPTLTEAASLLSDAYSQSGIGKMSEQTGSQLSIAIRDYFAEQANRFAGVAVEIRRNYSVIEPQVDAYCDALESNAELFAEQAGSVQSDLAEIRKYVDPDFLQTPSFSYFNARRQATPTWARSQRGKAAALTPRAEQYASEWEADASYMRRLGRRFDEWFQKGTDMGVLSQSGDYQSVGRLTMGSIREDSMHGAHWTGKPYPHFFTTADKAKLIGQMKGDWQAAGLEDFTDKHAPWLKAIIDGYFAQLGEIKTYGEENFLTASDGGTLMSPVTPTKLNAAEALLNKMQPGNKSFDENFNALISALPWQFEYPGDRNREKFRDLDPECLKAPLASRYTTLRNKFKEKLTNHRAQEGQMAEAEQRQQIAEARNNLSGLLNTLRSRLNQGESMIKSSLELKNASDIAAAIAKLNDFRTKLTDEPYPSARSSYDILYYATAKDGKSTDSAVQQAKTVMDDIGKMSSRIAETVAQLNTRRDTPQDASEEIKKLYEEFKQAYEYKNDAKVMTFIGNDWSAGDGTDLRDLEDYLRNSFTVFDQIKYAISNLKATKMSDNRYKVIYDITITGRIYDNNITHEEKSSVVEEVVVDSAGRMKIAKTLDGKFWYVR